MLRLWVGGSQLETVSTVWAEARPLQTVSRAAAIGLIFINTPDGQGADRMTLLKADSVAASP